MSIPLFLLDITVKNEYNLAGGSETLASFIGNISQTLLEILATVAVLFVLIGAVQYLVYGITGGDDQMLEKGKKTITNAVLGLIIAAFAWSIVTIAIDNISKI